MAQTCGCSAVEFEEDTLPLHFSAVSISKSKRPSHLSAQSHSRRRTWSVADCPKTSVLRRVSSVSTHVCDDGFPLRGCIYCDQSFARLALSFSSSSGSWTSLRFNTTDSDGVEARMTVLTIRVRFRSGSKHRGGQVAFCNCSFSIPRMKLVRYLPISLIRFQALLGRSRCLHS